MPSARHVQNLIAEICLKIGTVKLKTALATGFALLTICGLTASFALVAFSGYLHSAAQGIHESVGSIAASEELQIALLDHNREQLLFDLTRDPSHAAKRINAENQLKAGLERIELHVSSDSERILLHDAQRLIREYLTARMQPPPGEPPILTYSSASYSLDGVKSKIQEIIALNQSQAKDLQIRIDRQDKIARKLGFSVAITLLVVLIILAWGTRSAIYSPLVQLREAVQKFGKGDRRVRIEPMGLIELQEIGLVFNEMAENLERTQNDQLRFLSAIAHDLRNPVGAIKMSMEIIQLTLPESQKQVRELAEIVHRQSDQLNRMIEDLLDRTRIESGQLELKLEKHDLRESIRCATKLYQTTSQIHQFQMTIPNEPLLSLCDPTRMAQVLNNLISNAIKYSPNGGRIAISLSKTGNRIKIAVSDQGIGIVQEDRDSIFKPFQRSKATMDTIPGVGLGLSVSKRLIEAHGGLIAVESQRGKGSVFILELPASEG